MSDSIQELIENSYLKLQQAFETYQGYKPYEYQLTLANKFIDWWGEGPTASETARIVNDNYQKLLRYDRAYYSGEIDKNQWLSRTELANIEYRSAMRTNGDIVTDIFELVSLAAFDFLPKLVYSGRPLRLAQADFSESFSAYGRSDYSAKFGTAIETIDDRSRLLRTGAVTVNDLPVHIVTIDGVDIVHNTRTYQALKRAGISHSEMKFINSTDDPVILELTKRQLERLRGEIPDAELGIEPEDVKSNGKIFKPIERCFSAGTLIDMADGSQKPIESIEIGNEVAAYDPGANYGLGGLRSAKVTRTMTNIVDDLLDFHGVKMTPGHSTLCGDGPNKGAHIPLMDIILADGAVVDRDGRLIRAATNLPVGSEGDRFIEVAYITDKSQDVYSHAKMRLGTLMVGQDGKGDWRIMDALKNEGYQIFETGLIAKDGEEPHPLYWFGEVPEPADYILNKSRLTLSDLYSEDGTLTDTRIPLHAGMSVQ
ncbi:Hint domain-containing protein [Sneathiella glossodoripedis]|uniref:Hint domain-containing protein n=1 Tax=Sneathiella glossodoripedis TaxID=418853 RepID=UPI00046ED6EA|nr:Hint domain-containing protein [Sneathiella glossodoripedis]